MKTGLWETPAWPNGPGTQQMERPDAATLSEMFTVSHRGYSFETGMKWGYFQFH